MKPKASVLTRLKIWGKYYSVNPNDSKTLLCKKCNRVISWAKNYSLLQHMSNQHAGYDKLPNDQES